MLTCDMGSFTIFIVERKKERQLTGNIYRGRVTNILHNIQSAFIDIKRRRKWLYPHFRHHRKYQEI